MALAFWWSRRDDAPATATAAAPRPLRNAALERHPRLAKLVAEAPPADRVGLHLLDDPDLPVVVADFLLASRFPRYSRPLDAGMVDKIEPNRRNETFGPVKHEDRTLGPQDLQVLFTGDKFRLLGDEPLHAWLELQRDGTRVPVRVTRARAYAAHIVTRAPLGPETPLAFAGDPSHVQTTTFSVAGTEMTEHVGYVYLEVFYDYGGAKEGVERIEVYVQPPSEMPARFTGRFREELVDGSLRIHVGVEVLEAGTYHFDANLYDARGQPVAWVKAKPELAEGSQEVSFELFGRIVHEKDAEGPFTLTDLRGFRLLFGQDPDRRHLADHDGEYRTATYRREDFSAAEHWDAAREDQVRLLLEEAARGQKQLLKESIGQAIERGWAPAI